MYILANSGRMVLTVFSHPGRPRRRATNFEGRAIFRPLAPITTPCVYTGNIDRPANSLRSSTLHVAGVSLPNPPETRNAIVNFGNDRKSEEKNNTSLFKLIRYVAKINDLPMSGSCFLLL